MVGILAPEKKITSAIKKRKNDNESHESLKKFDEVPICDLMVVFSDEDNAWSFSLSQAIDFIVNDIYWDERGNWSHVTSAQVVPL